MKQIRKWLYPIGMIAGLGLFLLQLIKGFRSLFASNQPIGTPGLLGAAFLVLLFIIFLQMINYRQMLVGTGSLIGIKDLIKGYTLSFLPRYIPGTIWGYLSRGEWLHQRYQVSYDAVRHSSFLDLLVPLVSSLMMTGFWQAFTEQNRRIAFLLALLLPVLIWLLIRQVKKNDRFKKIRTLFLQYDLSVSTWSICLLNFTSQWVLYGVVLLLLNATFQAERSLFSLFTPTNLLAISYSFSLAWLIGFLIPFVPGGIGVREYILGLGMATYLPISASQAAFVSVMVRILYSLAELAWIFVGLPSPRASKPEDRA